VFQEKYTVLLSVLQRRKEGLFHLNKENHVCLDFLALDSNGVILIYNCLVILKNVPVNVPFSMEL